MTLKDSHISRVIISLCAIFNCFSRLVKVLPCPPLSPPQPNQLDQAPAIDTDLPDMTGNCDVKDKASYTSIQIPGLSMGAGRPFPPSPSDPEGYIVEFDGSDDPTHPYNWKVSTKYVSLRPNGGRKTC